MNKKRHNIHVKLSRMYKALFIAGFILFLSSFMLLNSKPVKTGFIATPVEQFFKQFKHTGKNFANIF